MIGGNPTNNDKSGDVICDCSNQHRPRKSPSRILQLFSQVHARIGTSQVWHRSIQTDKTGQSRGRPAVGLELGEDGRSSTLGGHSPTRSKM